ERIMIGESRDRLFELGRQAGFPFRPTSGRGAIVFRHQQIEAEDGWVVGQYVPDERRYLVARPRPLTIGVEAGRIDRNHGNRRRNALARKLLLIKVEQDELGAHEE